MRLILLLAATLMLAAGCSTRPREAWQPEQAEAVAWWIEDIAHCNPRDPGEIDFVDAGPRVNEIARWASGSVIEGRWVPPRRLLARRNRWPELRALIAAGEAVPSPIEGLFAPFPGVEPVRRAAVAAVVDAENDDRRFIDGLMATIGRPDAGVAEDYAEAVRCARRLLDRASGAGEDAKASPAR